MLAPGTPVPACPAASPCSPRMCLAIRPLPPPASGPPTSSAAARGHQSPSPDSTPLRLRLRGHSSVCVTLSRAWHRHSRPAHAVGFLAGRSHNWQECPHAYGRRTIPYDAQDSPVRTGLWLQRQRGCCGRPGGLRPRGLRNLPAGVAPARPGRGVRPGLRRGRPPHSRAFRPHGRPHGHSQPLRRALLHYGRHRHRAQVPLRRALPPHRPRRPTGPCRHARAVLPHLPRRERPHVLPL